jgi:ankyrin repeat protein
MKNIKKILFHFIFLVLINNFYINSINNQLKDFYLALSGIIMEDNNSSHNTLDAFIQDKNGKDNTEYALKRDWGIKNHRTCVTMIENLFNDGHSEKLKKLLNYARSYSFDEKEIKKLNLDIYNTRRLLFVYKYLKYFNKKEMLYAWDIGRVVSVSRWCYHLGYLSEDEAWTFIDKAGKKLITIFDNWEDYGANYVLGRIFWKAAFDDYSPLHYRTALIYYTLLDEKTGIWKKIKWPRGKKTNRKYLFIEKYFNISQFYISLKKDDVDSIKKIIQTNKEYYKSTVNISNWPPVFTSLANKSDNVTKFLITNGFDINAINPNDDRSPLMEALYKNNKEISNLLIKNNAYINVIDCDKWTPLMYALRYSEPDVIKNLLNHNASINVANDNGWTPLMFSIRYSTPEIIKIILDKNPDINKKNNNGWNALIFALRHNTPEITKLILEYNPEINIENANGWTPLMFAIRYSSSEIVNKLLDAGADINTENKNNWTPLIFAIRYSNNEIIEKILNSGANINVKTKDGWTPLHFAAYKSNFIIGEKLIRLGSDPDALNNRSKKPIDLIKNNTTKIKWENLILKLK